MHSKNILSSNAFLMQPKRFMLTCSLMIAVIAYGFYPFSWSLPSTIDVQIFNQQLSLEMSAQHDNLGADWDHDGLSIPTASIGLADFDRKSIKTLPGLEYFDLELLVRPYGRYQYGPARIFTVSENSYFCNVTVAQQINNLVIGVRRENSDLNGRPDFIVKNVFSHNQDTKMRIFINNSILLVYVNEELAVLENFDDQVFNTWDKGYRVAIGNEFSFNRAWLGKVFKANLKTNFGEKQYIKNKLLVLPKVYKYEGRMNVLNRYPARANLIKDCIINYFGFLFVGGMLAALLFGRISLLRMMVICFFISLLIEFGQIFNITRISSITDLFLNTLGAMTGIYIIHYVLKRKLQASN